MTLLDNLKQIYTKSLPNWIDKASDLLSWLSTSLTELASIESDFLTEADYTDKDATKAKSNWLCNQSVYIGADNIKSFESASVISRLIDRGTINGLIELSYYLDGDAGTYKTSQPPYSWTETDTSWAFTSLNVEVIIYKTTLSKTLNPGTTDEDTVGVMSDRFWIADVSSPGDAVISYTPSADDYHLCPSVSHATVRIIYSRLNQPLADTQEFIRKHFIPAGLPVIFI